MEITVYVVYDRYDNEIPVCVGDVKTVATYLGIPPKQVPPRAWHAENPSGKAFEGFNEKYRYKLMRVKIDETTEDR